MNPRRSMLILAASCGALAAQPQTADWQLEPVPPCRTGFRLVHHEALAATVLFGGFPAEGLGDTWLWQDGWRRIESQHAPTSRYDYAVVYDSLRDRVVLVGGRDSATVFADAWAFDGSDWTQLPGTPPPRYGHGLAYDRARDRVVLKAGRSTTFGTPSTELWEYDGSAWTLQVEGGDVPGGGEMAYDVARGEVLHLAGTTLRAWDGATWTLRTDQGLPGGGEMLYDPSGQRMLIVNPIVSGDHLPGVFEYTGQQWHQISALDPVETTIRRMAFEPSTGRVVALQTTPSSPGWSIAHTYVLENDAWRIAQQGLPDLRRDAAMAFDRDRGVMVLHAGTKQNSEGSGVHELDGRRWTTRILDFNSLSPRRVHHAMVFDEAEGATLVLGGTFSLSPGLFRWTSAGFSFFDPATNPPGRRRHAMAYDRLRQRTLLFGGEGAGVFGDTWIWDGVDWSEVTSPGPSARRDSAICYDEARDRVVLFGGRDAGGALGDTWEFDGLQWLERSPQNAPAPRGNHVLVYHEAWQKTVLWGGVDAEPLRETWLWDGDDWSRWETQTVPDTAEGAAAAYDPERQEILLFGGGPLGASRGELWRLGDPTMGTWTSSGVGCDAGSGPLVLDATPAPVIGATATVTLANVPSAFVSLPLAWVGFDGTTFQGVPVPIPLTVLGAPDCFVWASADVPLPMLPLGQTAEAQLGLPDAPAIIGLELYVQGAVWDFAASALSTANLLLARIGAP